jgi:AraC-like DNA-binding protein
MAAPPAWTMHSADGGPPIDFQPAFDDPSILRRADSGEPTTTFIAGRFSLALPHADFLARLMLPVVHVRARDLERARLGTLLRILGDEVLNDRPGRSLVTDRLLEILLVEALRQPASGHMAAGPGLLAGLRDPKLAPALRSLHDNIRHPWRVGDLARTVAMSRSAFSARFTQVVGVSPIDYLISWRMTVARNMLISTRKSIATIAETVGYQSTSAFSLAFSKANGCAPGTYRAQRSITDA